MTDALKLGFGPFAAPARGVLVVFCDDGLRFGAATRKALGSSADLVARAAKAERFTGKSGTALELIVPAGLKVGRLVVIGAGKTADLKQKDFVKLGGIAMGKLPVATEAATVFADLPSGALKPDQAQGRREAAGEPRRHGRRCRCRRRPQGLRRARGDRRRRGDGARPRQRAG